MPKRVDVASQRRMIADAAILVITRSGLEGARLRDVASAAEVTTGAVMHYFDGKDAVVEAALEEIVRRTLERMGTASPASQPGDVPAFVGRVCQYLPLDRARRGEWRVWLAFWGRAIGDERLREVHRGYYQEIVERLVAPLSSLRGENPAVSVTQTRRCADALIAALDGVGVRATLEPTLWPPQRQIETFSGLLQPLLFAFANGIDPWTPQGADQ